EQNRSRASPRSSRAGDDVSSATRCSPSHAASSPCATTRRGARWSASPSAADGSAARGQRRDADDHGLAVTDPVGTRPEEAQPRDPVLLVVDRGHLLRQRGIVQDLALADEVRSRLASDPCQHGAALRDALCLVAAGNRREVDGLAVEHEPDGRRLARAAVGASGGDVELLRAAERVAHVGSELGACHRRPEDDERHGELEPHAPPPSRHRCGIDRRRPGTSQPGHVVKLNFRPGRAIARSVTTPKRSRKTGAATAKTRRTTPRSRPRKPQAQPPEPEPVAAELAPELPPPDPEPVAEAPVEAVIVTGVPEAGFAARVLPPEPL